MHMVKYGQETKKTKADYIECSYLRETQFRENAFGRDKKHKVEQLVLVFIDFE